MHFKHASSKTPNLKLAVISSGGVKRQYTFLAWRWCDSGVQVNQRLFEWKLTQSWCCMAGTSMADMVGSGVVEGLQPDTRHGVEAQLALEDQASMPNVVPHKLNPNHEQLPADAAMHTEPHVVDANPAPVDATQPLPAIEPITVDPVPADVLHPDEHHAEHHDPQHAVEGLKDPLVDPVVHEVHHAHTGEAEQVVHQSLPGSADPAIGVQPGAHAGAVGATLPVSDGMASGLSAEEHVTHGDVHLRDQQQVADPHDNIFGRQSSVLPQTAGYGGVLSQLLSFGVPVACVFAAVAFVLWKRMGPLRPSTSSV